jgi:hypothetical protein
LSATIVGDAPGGYSFAADADAAFGTLPAPLLEKATRLRRLSAPHAAPPAAPPAGHCHHRLIAHPVVVTNFREIYNDHIAAHIMAFVLVPAIRPRCPLA